ncbi:hypothetical protein HK104_008007 [Borealophlyctis nickersoniae]|nr:hypothetical protein HK104_008007 [Borealophlyctis nickersoniae]
MNSTKKTGLESLLILPDNSTVLAGRQSDATVFAFRLPVDTESVDVEFMGSFIPPGPRTDLSAMTLWRDILWFVYDKPKRIVGVNTSYIPTHFSPDEVLDISNVLPVAELHTGLRGVEGIAFVEDSWVVLGMDPPRGKGKKEVLRFTVTEFFECFAGNGVRDIPRVA